MPPGKIQLASSARPRPGLRLSQPGQGRLQLQNYHTRQQVRGEPGRIAPVSQRSCCRECRKFQARLSSHDLPWTGLGGEIDEGSQVRPVHVPDHIFSRLRVSPEDVGLAVTVEINRPHDLPWTGLGGEHRRRKSAFAPFMYQTTFSPVCGVSPEDVGLAVAVEITSPHDLPGEGGTGASIDKGSHVRPIHVPDHILARLRCFSRGCRACRRR